MLTAAMEASVTPDSNVTPSYLKIQALDYPNFALNEYFDQGADFIHQNIATTNILVHCMAGISRSVSLVIAYLIKYRKMEFEGALAHLRSRRAIVLSLLRKSNPNEGFVNQLCEYEKRIKKEDKAD
jgi:atypical dual specificity phosphatase